MVSDQQALYLSPLGHDLQSAMSDIVGGLRLIGAGGMDPETALQLERVRAASDGMARMLEESLALVDPAAASAGPRGSDLEMRHFLYELEMRWAGRAHEKALAFQIVVAPEVPRVLAMNRTALDRILSNILSNAIKFTDTGTVRLSIALGANNGPGFSPAALAQLFRFAARPEGSLRAGLGFGLHIAKDMVERLGGTILVTNLPGGGAEVALDLPFAASQSLAPNGALTDLSGVSVLVAEDNATSQLLLAQMLATMGARVEVVADGCAALARLNAGGLDVALIDVEMPCLSGIEVIRRCRSAEAADASLDYLPIVAVTAYAGRGEQAAIRAAGADRIVQKPLPAIDTLGRTLAEVLGRAPQPRPAAERADNAAERPDNGAELERLLQIAGPVAQWIERSPPKRQVACSSHAGVTTASLRPEGVALLGAGQGNLHYAVCNAGRVLPLHHQLSLIHSALGNNVAELVQRQG